jgi:host factor-I protein
MDKEAGIMTKSTINLQEVFLNQARKERMLVTIFLTNGFQFKGIVRGFDSFTVAMDCEGKQQLVYKHAISTIVPSRQISFMSGENAET